MQIKKRISNSITLVLLLTACVLVFLTTHFFTSYRDNLSFPIAKNARWVIRLDAETLLKQEAYNVLLGQKDDQFMQQLQDILMKEDKDKKSSKLYINIKEDLVLYRFKHNNTNILALAFKTTDATSFNENINSYLSKKQAGMAAGEHALIFLSTSGKSISKADLSNLLNKTITESQTNLTKATADQSEFMAMQVNDVPENALLKSLNASIQYKDESLMLNGKLEFIPTAGKPLDFGLNHKGLSISSRIVPSFIVDTVLHFLPSKLKQFKDIESFIIDFQGTYLEDPTDSLPSVLGFLPTPIMNLIVRTKKPCNIEDFWQFFPEKIKQGKNVLNFGNVVYQLKQLNPYTYFIGVDVTSINSNVSQDLLSIQGTLSNMIHIQGSNFVTTFIENMRPIKALNEFLSSTKNIDIVVKQRKGNENQLSGNITFGSSKHPIHEITKLLVSLVQVMK